MKRIISKEADEFIKDNYEHMSYKDLADMFGVTERQMRGHINNIGLKKIGKTTNVDYFKSIDTADKAYWLGFIFADGYIAYNTRRRSYELSMELNTEDKYVLDILRNDINAAGGVKHKENHKIFNGYEYDTSSDVLRIHSKKICDDLVSLGVVPNKTNEASYPKIEKYRSSFVRGFLDGDGCIYISSKNVCYVSFTNSNESFLKYLNDVVHEELGISGSIYKEKEKKYRLIFYRSSDVKMLLDWIYSDCGDHFLRRKRDKYKSFYGLAA